MDALLSQSEVDKKIEEVVAPLREELIRARATIEEAKRTIKSLLQHIHGVKSERGSIVLTAEGQQFLDPTWVNGAERPQPASPAETPEKERTPRDRRGVAQRHPHLPITPIDGPLPEALRQQVETGDLAVRRTGRFDDSLVVPQAKPYIRRVFEIEVVNPAKNEALLQVPLPDRIVPDGVLADESIHELTIAKFLDAIPFHRTLKAWSRNRLDIARQVVNDAFAAWSGCFKPLADTIIEQVFQSAVVHADESWARLQAEKHCEKVNIWTVVGGGQVGYRYTADRNHARAQEIIPSGFTGYLVTDAWQGWAKLEQIINAGCNAHARRPFAKEADLSASDGAQNPDAALIVELYAEIYRLEHAALEGPPEELLDRRRRIRQEHSKSVMERIRKEAERIAGSYSFSHPLAEGGRYIINHYDKLILFLDNPLLPPDNNAAENALRINALIRKNSLFFGSEEGGERAAIALTVLHSCRIANVEPHGYLAEITPKLLLHRRGIKQDLVQLTPKAIADSRKLS